MIKMIAFNVDMDVANSLKSVCDTYGCTQRLFIESAIKRECERLKNKEPLFGETCPQCDGDLISGHCNCEKRGQ